MEEEAFFVEGLLSKAFESRAITTAQADPGVRLTERISKFIVDRTEQNRASQNPVPVAERPPVRRLLAVAGRSPNLVRRQVPYTEWVAALRSACLRNEKHRSPFVLRGTGTPNAVMRFTLQPFRGADCG